MQAHAVTRLCARDEAAVAIHIAVAFCVPAAGLPERGDVRERQRFFVEHTDLFVDLKPRCLVLLKEDVARLPLLRGVENAVDSLLHGSRNFYHTRQHHARKLANDSNTAPSQRKSSVVSLSASSAKNSEVELTHMLFAQQDGDRPRQAGAIG